MNREKALQDVSLEELVQRFVVLALNEYEAVNYNQTSKYRRLYEQKIAVTNELRSRAGDQRRALTALYTHPNVQVRLAAARATLALNYTEARSVVQAIADSGVFPQAGDAGMTLSNLDRGVFRPS